jgi:hypothetical protein
MKLQPTSIIDQESDVRIRVSGYGRTFSFYVLVNRINQQLSLVHCSTLLFLQPSGLPESIVTELEKRGDAQSLELAEQMKKSYKR